jgi:hypothetical protein
MPVWLREPGWSLQCGKMLGMPPINALVVVRTVEEYGQSKDCHHEKHSQEQEEQKFGDFVRRSSNPREAKKSDQQTNHQKHKSPSQHGRFLLCLERGDGG